MNSHPVLALSGDCATSACPVRYCSSRQPRNVQVRQSSGCDMNATASSTSTATADSSARTTKPATVSPPDTSHTVRHQSPAIPIVPAFGRPNPSDAGILLATGRSRLTHRDRPVFFCARVTKRRARLGAISLVSRARDQNENDPERTCKPGSVESGHFSRTAVARRLQRPTRK